MSYTEKVARYLRRNRRWVDARELMRVGGLLAWRSRLAECRTLLGMRVENRQRKSGKITISEYRYRGKAA